MFSYNPYISTELCKIMGIHGSDKGNIDITNSWHNYTTLYYSIFNNFRNNKLRIFELGLGTNNINLPSNMGKDGIPGASLRGWADFFPNSHIFGADIDKDILFNENRINTFYCDQTNPNIIKDMWNNSLLCDNFDIIIEDGLHTYDANIIFFENSIHKLNKGGYYIIEDVLTSEIYKYNYKINEWKNKYTYLDINLIQIPNNRNNHDNNLIVIYYK